jgi:hypothetical protein
VRIIEVAAPAEYNDTDEFEPVWLKSKTEAAALAKASFFFAVGNRIEPGRVRTEVGAEGVLALPGSTISYSFT